MKQDEIDKLRDIGLKSGAHADIESYYLDREAYMDDYYRRYRNHFEMMQKLDLTDKPNDPRSRLLNIGRFNLFFGPLSLHTGAFIPTIEMLGTPDQV